MFISSDPYDGNPKVTQLQMLNMHVSLSGLSHHGSTKMISSQQNAIVFDFLCCLLLEIDVMHHEILWHYSLLER